MIESREVRRDGSDSLVTVSQYCLHTTRVERAYIAELQSHQAHSSELGQPRAYQENSELKGSVIMENLACDSQEIPRIDGERRITLIYM